MLTCAHTPTYTHTLTRLVHLLPPLTHLSSPTLCSLLPLQCACSMVISTCMGTVSRLAATGGRSNSALYHCFVTCPVSTVALCALISGGLNEQHSCTPLVLYVLQSTKDSIQICKQTHRCSSLCSLSCLPPSHPSSLTLPPHSSLLHSSPLPSISHLSTSFIPPIILPHPSPPLPFPLTPLNLTPPPVPSPFSECQSDAASPERWRCTAEPCTPACRTNGNFVAIGNIITPGLSNWYALLNRGTASCDLHTKSHWLVVM